MMRRGVVSARGIPRQAVNGAKGASSIPHPAKRRVSRSDESPRKSLLLMLPSYQIIRHARSAMVPRGWMIGIVALWEVWVGLDPRERKPKADGQEGADGGTQQRDDAHEVPREAEMEERDQHHDQHAEEDRLPRQDRVGAMAIGGEALGVSAKGLKDQEGDGPPEYLPGKRAMLLGEVLDGAEVPMADGRDGEQQQKQRHDHAGGKGEEKGALIGEVALREADGDGLIAERAKGERVDEADGDQVDGEHGWAVLDAVEDGVEHEDGEGKQRAAKRERDVEEEDLEDGRLLPGACP